MKVKRIPLLFYILCISFIAMPLFSLILSDTGGQSLLENEILWQAVRVSLQTTGFMMFLTIFAGTPAAYAYARTEFKGKALVNVILDLPLVLPPAVAGLLLLMTFGRNGWIGEELYKIGVQIPFSMLAVVTAQTFVGLPIYIKTLAQGIMSVDERLELTAMTLGDTRLMAFMRVTLPLAAGSLFTGAIMAWARALAEFGATIMFAGNLKGVTQTLPLAIYSAMETDMGAALGIAQVMVLVSMILLLAVHFASKGGKRHV